jgi:DDE superfamily endonuclease
VCGNVNFTNLSRYSEWSERTYRRQYRQEFCFMGLNAQLIEAAIPREATCIGAMDCSFIPKSGKATYGLDWFYNGSASRAQKGLEISVIAVIDVEAHRGYSLSVQQTPASLAKRKATPQSQHQSIRWAAIEQARQMLEQLPVKVTPTADVGKARVELTRMDYYLKHLQESYAYLPTRLKYWVVDGFYSKKKFVDGVVGLNLQVISKLRSDADMRYLYSGVQQPRGAKRKYDGKVDLSDLSRLSHVRQLEPGLDLYTLVVWHVSLKRKIRIAALVDTRKPGKTGVALLFSTDIELDAQRILQYYKARFQIEFIFRDAKQFTGLCDAQTRQSQTLDFHFNASLTALNLAKYEDQLRSTKDNPKQPLPPFSMASSKRVAFNDHLLERFISMLELNPTLIKSHPNYQNLRSYGIIAP